VPIQRLRLEWPSGQIRRHRFREGRVSAVLENEVA
jgi:hypothetical protein